MRVGLSPSVMGNMLIAILRTTGRQPRFTAQTRTLKMYISRTTTGKWTIKSGKEGRAMKLVSIVFEKAASEYRLYYKDEKTGKPYHITANHLLDKEKLWARDANYHQDPYRISWTIA